MSWLEIVLPFGFVFGDIKESWDIVKDTVNNSVSTMAVCVRAHGEPRPWVDKETQRHWTKRHKDIGVQCRMYM